MKNKNSDQRPGSPVHTRPLPASSTQDDPTQAASAARHTPAAPPATAPMTVTTAVGQAVPTAALSTMTATAVTSPQAAVPTTAVPSADGPTALSTASPVTAVQQAVPADLPPVRRTTNVAPADVPSATLTAIPAVPAGLLPGDDHLLPFQPGRWSCFLLDQVRITITSAAVPHLLTVKPSHAFLATVDPQAINRDDDEGAGGRKWFMTSRDRDGLVTNKQYLGPYRRAAGPTTRVVIISASRILSRLLQVTGTYIPDVHDPVDLNAVRWSRVLGTVPPDIMFFLSHHIALIVQQQVEEFIRFLWAAFGIVVPPESVRVTVSHLELSWDIESPEARYLPKALRAGWESHLIGAYSSIDEDGVLALGARHRSGELHKFYIKLADLVRYEVVLRARSVWLKKARLNVTDPLLFSRQITAIAADLYNHIIQVQAMSDLVPPPEANPLALLLAITPKRSRAKMEEVFRALLIDGELRNTNSRYRQEVARCLAVGLLERTALRGVYRLTAKYAESFRRYVTEFHVVEARDLVRYVSENDPEGHGEDPFGPFKLDRPPEGCWPVPEVLLPVWRALAEHIYTQGFCDQETAARLAAERMEKLYSACGVPVRSK